MRRRSLLAALVVAGLAALPASAGAQQPQAVTVSAQNFSFAPAAVTITAGDTVRWQNLEGFHNVHFDFSPTALFPPARPDAASWQDVPAQTFDEPGTYTYFCDPHRAIGMVATITVSARAAEVRRLAIARSAAGASVVLELTAPAAVTGRLERRPRRGRGRYRAFGTVDFGTVQAGVQRRALRRTAEGRRLTAGRYRLRLEVAGAAQRALTFAVGR
jgi:plastocyanin